MARDTVEVGVFGEGGGGGLAAAGERSRFLTTGPCELHSLIHHLSSSLPGPLYPATAHREEVQWVACERLFVGREHPQYRGWEGGVVVGTAEQTHLASAILIEPLLVRSSVLGRVGKPTCHIILGGRSSVG